MAVDVRGVFLCLKHEIRHMLSAGGGAIVLGGTLLGRPAAPEEIASTVLYLCSPMTTFSTGQTFIIDGGQTAH